jgi:hypothetical protein
MSGTRLPPPALDRSPVGPVHQFIYGRHLIGWHLERQQSLDNFRSLWSESATLAIDDMIDHARVEFFAGIPGGADKRPLHYTPFI